jgi:hypothetical protein
MRIKENLAGPNQTDLGNREAPVTPRTPDEYHKIRNAEWRLLRVKIVGAIVIVVLVILASHH